MSEETFEEFSITGSSQNNPRLISISGGFPHKKERSYKLVGELLDILARLDSSDASMPITLAIRSPGGSGNTCLLLLKQMDKLRSPIHTITKNIAGSGATLIFISGEKGHRYIFPKSCIFIHKARLVKPILADDVVVGVERFEEKTLSREQRLDLRTVDQRTARLLYECTDGKILDIVPGGRDCEDDEAKRAEAILSFLGKDKAFPADMAVRYGLADHIIEE